MKKLKVELRDEKEERLPFNLPAFEEKDVVGEMTHKYACLIWREIDIYNIQQQLRKLYEEAYSDGLRHMDIMHVNTDKSIVI